MHSLGPKQYLHYLDRQTMCFRTSLLSIMWIEFDNLYPNLGPNFPWKLHTRSCWLSMGIPKEMYSKDQTWLWSKQRMYDGTVWHAYCESDGGLKKD